MNEKDALNSITIPGNSNTLTVSSNQAWSDSTITVFNPSEWTVSADISPSTKAAWDTLVSDSSITKITEPHVQYHNVFGLEYAKEIEKIMKGIDKKYNKRDGQKTVKETINKIKKIIFKNPATIIIWKDGTKTVVKCQNYEPFDEEKGLAMALLKHIFNESPRYNDFFTKCEDKIERL